MNSGSVMSNGIRFTHVDPFEDTERRPRCLAWPPGRWHVSPTSIRSRILKEYVAPLGPSTTYWVSPTSIRSRILKVAGNPIIAVSITSFTHVDPFEDTESWHIEVMKHERLDVSPTSIRSRILKENGVIFISGEVDSFTHVDPFEDTERSPGQCRT